MLSVMTSSTTDRQYHHGNLRRALLDEALRIVDADGPSAVSLRELARRIGVSHAAPAHHFADKTALFTALAVEGQTMLAEGLEAAAASSPDDGVAHSRFLDVGLAYVRFAAEHPAHIRVMYQPSLYNTDDSQLDAARHRTFETLFTTAGAFKPGLDAAQVGLAGWCLMHGLAALWQGGNLDQFGDDPVALAKWVAEVTFTDVR
jgi:AcrR family transcriptional regulator